MKDFIFNAKLRLTALSRDDIFIKTMVNDSKLIPFAGPPMMS